MTPFILILSHLVVRGTIAVVGRASAQLIQMGGGDGPKKPGNRQATSDA
jgi:hypothetical protein